MAIKRNEILPFVSTDELGGYHAQWNKSGKDILYNITYMWNLKKQPTSECNRKERFRDTENELVVTGVDRQGWGAI